MNNRRGFLSSILKAGIGAMILPAAVISTRRWVKPYGNLIWHGEMPDFESQMFQFLPSFQDFMEAKAREAILTSPNVYYDLTKSKNWKPNMGNTIRTVSFNRTPLIVF